VFVRDVNLLTLNFINPKYMIGIIRGKKMKKITSFKQSAIGLIMTMLLSATSLQAAPTDDFVIKVDTGSSKNFKIPTNTEETYNYNIDCNNDGTNEATGATGSYTCSYAAAGTYTIRIKDNVGDGTGFPEIYFNGDDDNPGESRKIVSLDQWGTGKWETMANAFSGAKNMLVPATDAPDLTAVTDMSYMFDGATAANPDTSSWDITNVEDMTNFLNGVAIPAIDYDKMLIGFAAQDLKLDVNFSGGDSS